MGESSKSRLKRQRPPQPSTDYSGHDSPKKLRVDDGPNPSTPEHCGAPDTPKSDFHKYAESILSPTGMQSPGASLTPNLLTAPSSRDWSPYAKQNQQGAGRPSDLDYFGFGDMTSSSSARKGLFDSASMDMYSHSRTSSSDAPSAAQLLLSPGFVFDDMIGATTPTMTEIARLHRVGTNESDSASERKGMNLFGSSTETAQGRLAQGQSKNPKEKQHVELVEQEEEGDEVDNGEDDDSEDRTDRFPATPGLTAITAAGKEIGKQSGIKSRNRKVTTSAMSDADSDVEERLSRLKGRPPMPPSTRHAHSLKGVPVDSCIEFPGTALRSDPYGDCDGSYSSGNSNGRRPYAAIAPRSGRSSTIGNGSVNRSDADGAGAVGGMEHATPETAVSMAHPNMSPDPKSLAPCNCKKSRCLKLYCDCFRAQRYCNGCHCKSCANLESHESERIAARNAITERNPEAFKPRIAIKEVVLNSTPRSSAVGSPPPGAAVFGQHQSGCHCKKSACLKKYCECFQAGVPCLDRCRCLDCKNTAENVAGGFTNVSKGAGSSGFMGLAGSSPALGSYSADMLKRQMLGQGRGGGGKSLLDSCFPEVDNIPDDKPIYNKAQAEQAAFEIVSAFLRGEISVPGLEPFSVGNTSLSRVPTGKSEVNGHGRPHMLMPLADADSDSGGLRSGKLFSGGKPLSANSSLVQIGAPASLRRELSTLEAEPDDGSTSA